MKNTAKAGSALDSEASLWVFTVGVCTKARCGGGSASPKLKEILPTQLVAHGAPELVPATDTCPAQWGTSLPTTCARSVRSFGWQLK